MEPERNIEKLLRAYAKKRHADAGDALKLHPATRRMLQAEVTRQKPRPDEEAESLSLWELFRQQWAFLAGFALIVFFGAALLMPALSKAKYKSKQAVAMNNLRQIGLAAQMAAEENNGKLPVTLDALTNLLGPDRLLTDTESGQRFIYIAGGEDLDGLPSNSVLAYSPTDKKGRAVLFADGHVEVIKGDRLSGLTNRGLPQMIAANKIQQRQLAEAPAEMTVANGNAGIASPISDQVKSKSDRSEAKPANLGVAAHGAGELAVSAPAAPVASLDRLAKEQDAGGKDFAAHTSSVWFASAASQSLAFGLQNSFKNTVVPAGAAPVLANFQVQQNGNAIRVVDADGSVYDGSLLPESAVAQNMPAPAATPPPLVTATGQIERAKVGARSDVSQAARNNFFCVSGTNQTLKQNVVFTGNLLAISGETTNMQQAFGGSGGGGGGGGGGSGGSQFQLALTNQWSWPNSRIAGTAVIAGTNRIEINAVPQAP